MTAAVHTTRARSRPRRLLRGLLLTAGLLIAPLLLFLLLIVVEAEPRVADRPPADGTSAELARGVAERVRVLMDDGDVHSGWSATEAEMNGVLASAGRLVPGMRGRAAVNDEALAVEASFGAPLLPVGIWANVRLAFAESADGLHVAEARVGRVPLPPALAERALRFGLDRALGPGSGDAAVESIASLALSPGRGAGHLRHRR